MGMSWLVTVESWNYQKVLMMEQNVGSMRLSIAGEKRKTVLWKKGSRKSSSSEAES